MPGPLDGVKVVELGIWVSIPGAAAMLADWGAEVVKVESPEGDMMRWASRAVLPKEIPVNPYYDPVNRGKRGVVLDLRKADELDAMVDLIGSADVFLTNIRLGGLQRLGLDPETLLGKYPRLVYGLFTGFGLTGPDADSPAFDLGVYWARGGVADILSLPGEAPPIQRSAMGDNQAALAMVGAVSAALYSREATGKGQLVTSSLLRIAAYSLNYDVNGKLMIDLEPERPDRTKANNPLWNNYATSDGRRFWLMSPAPDRHWPVLARLVGHPEWIAEERYETQAARAANCVDLIAALDSAFASDDMATWAARFATEPDFSWAPVNTVTDLINDPQAAFAGLFVDVPERNGVVREVNTPVDFYGTPGAPTRGAPLLGEHTEEVLAELGRTVAD